MSVQVPDILEVLKQEAGELDELCKRNGHHDICEFCEMGGMLLRAAHTIRTLREDSAWLMETWLYEYTDLDKADEHIVDHSCDFDTRPDYGACDWHEKWFDIAERNGMMEQFFLQDSEREEA